VTAEWLLIDYGTPLERAPDDHSPYDYFATSAIQSEGQLQEELARLRQAPPAMVSLVSPSKESVEIGLGPELSGLRWEGPDPRSWCKLALALEVVAEEEQGFADGGGGFVFEPRHLFPTDEVIEAAMHFYRTGRPPGWLEWEDG
jgi:hypothetical protein